MDNNDERQRHRRAPTREGGLALRAAVVGLATAALCGTLHLLGVGIGILVALAVVIAVVTLFVPWIAAEWAGDIVRWFRTRAWRHAQGRFHAFGGVPLHIDDDGRHVWMDGPGLQRILRRDEPDDVLAARLSGHWRRDADRTLMLRVDAVVAHLATMPGRTDPRIQRLRRYLEREVLYPAGQRRARG